MPSNTQYSISTSTTGYVIGSINTCKEDKGGEWEEWGEGKGKKGRRGEGRAGRREGGGGRGEGMGPNTSIQSFNTKYHMS